MEDPEFDDEQRLDDSHENSQYRACYIFHSAKGHRFEPPTKKRRLNGSNSNGSTTISSVLDSATKHARVLERRQETFDEFWRQTSTQFNSITNILNENTSNELVAFFRDLPPPQRGHHLRTALILPGVERTTYGHVLDHLRSSSEDSTIIIDLQSRHCPNLQSTLKAVIKTAITEHSGIETYEDHLLKHKGLVPLNFDLELLELYATSKSIRRVLVSLRDVELFDGQLLNELIFTLSTWQSRIPFALSLEVTGAVDILEFRLSKACVHQIHAQRFDFSGTEDVRFSLLAQTQCSGDSNGFQVSIGPTMVGSLFDVGQTQGKTAQAFVYALKYSYMSHFYANPLSDLLSEDAEMDVPRMAKAIRCTDSFQSYCQTLLESRDNTSAANVQALLINDDELLKEVRLRIIEGQALYNMACRSIEAFADLYVHLQRIRPGLRQSKVDVALDLYRSINDLTASDTFLAIETVLNETTASEALDLCRNLQPSTRRELDLDSVTSTLEHERLRKQHNNTNGVDPPTNGSLKNVAGTPRKRIKKASSTLSDHGEPGNAVKFDAMKIRLKSVSLDISKLFLHEAYVLSSHAVRPRQILESNPRTAIERALLTPGDYLGCECDTQSRDGPVVTTAMHEEVNRHGSPPPASAIFALLQEAPTNINVRDLFDAFISRYGRTALHPTDVQEMEDVDAATRKVLMTKFYQALAELKLAGLVRPSTNTQIKKRMSGKAVKTSANEVDHIAKTSWVGV